MDHYAITKIANMAVDAENQRIPNNLIHRIAALPSDYTIHDLERYREGRERFRGALLTNSLADFVQYTKEKAGAAKAPVFIDADNLSANAIFDLGDDNEPGHCEHTATLKLNATAAFAALLQIDGKKLDQRTLIDWLEDWSANLQPYGASPDELKPFSAALAAIREVKITQKRESENRVGDFNAARSTLEEVEASAKQGLPGGFLFTTEPYTGLPSREFRVRLAVLSGDGEKPALNLRIIRLDEARQNIAQDFKSVLFKDLSDKAVLTIGTFKA